MDHSGDETGGGENRFRLPSTGIFLRLIFLLNVLPMPFPPLFSGNIPGAPSVREGKNKPGPFKNFTKQGSLPHC
ncbi:MAG: hypothetical protein ACXVMS_17645 [Flavisolibacter sp.]